MKNKRVQKLSEQKLLQYGCSKEGVTYRCIRKLKAPDFYAVITYEGQELHAEVYDAQLREPYTPFHVPGANGSFVSSIREEVEELLEDMVQQCIDGNPYRTRILDYVAERYQSYPQFPWKSAPEHGTLKTAKGKWYGVIMHIPYRSLGIDVDGMTDVCNLKNCPEFIQELIDYKCFYPAYHMNKTYWFTILLEQKLSWKQLQKLIDESYRLVSAGK
ncbi:hypothetical protein CIAN88_09975 [[Clostridium] innocuum]|uniref:MmcQ/YjbR family DNA-binding protein n=1 Tax=Clostridium innocuum TaxID=1522 RepID=A0A099I7N0_CLOIN|nr:MmcQ/YjbR family DNA-binding protein [[Clostridium] innocuum]KGJ53257.1 hypothetical protein CIAN88_09975 [[Clostridium] innocuum]